MSRIPLGRKHSIRIYGDLRTLLNVSWYTWVETAHNNLSIKLVVLMLVVEFNFDLGTTKEHKEWRATQARVRAEIERRKKVGAARVLTSAR